MVLALHASTTSSLEAFIKTYERNFFCTRLHLPRTFSGTIDLLSCHAWWRSALVEGLAAPGHGRLRDVYY
jgi:hypothetical protein